MRRVRCARVFAADWSASHTSALAPLVRKAREFAVRAAGCGLQCDEILDSIREEWPSLRAVSVTVDGAVLVIEA